MFEVRHSWGCILAAREGRMRVQRASYCIEAMRKVLRTRQTQGRMRGEERASSRSQARDIIVAMTDRLPRPRALGPFSPMSRRQSFDSCHEQAVRPLCHRGTGWRCDSRRIEREPIVSTRRPRTTVMLRRSKLFIILPQGPTRQEPTATTNKGAMS